MYRRTSYNTLNAQVRAGAHKALAALCVLFIFFSCSGDSVLSTIDESTDSTDPLTFTCALTQEEQTAAAARRAGTPVYLKSDFKESTYKAFATTHQTTVMQDYHVEYKTTGTAWDGTIRPYWDYTGVPGQYTHYWDYSNFPYRFHAVAPYDAPAGGSPRVTFNDKDLRITAPYACQTCHNGMVQPDDATAEPYTVAQLHRATDGKDYDLLAISDDNTHLNNGSTVRHRQVWMPFHHLNAKIRFAVYSLAPWATANALYIKDLTVKVVSDHFTVSAAGYHASCSGTGTPDDPYTGWRVDPPYATDGSGTGFVLSAADQVSTYPTLFRFDGGKEVEGNDLSLCQTQKTAFFLQCKNGMMQLPQTDVRMTVSFKIYKADGTLYQTFTDVPIEYELDGTYHPKHTWRSGFIYTYYLVLGTEGSTPDKLALTFTASLVPWEDISGSLSTDLEQ